MPIPEVRFIWMNGEFVPWSEAKVHVLTHALHYGSGVFEGIRAYQTGKGTAVFRLKEHIDRLFESAHIYKMPIPYSREQIIDAVKQTIKKNELQSCYIRPIVFRGYGEMGLNPLNSPVDVAIAVWPWGAYLGEEGIKNGITAQVSSFRRINVNTLPPAAKATGQYINSILAKIEAVENGFNEAIMLDERGFVSEGSGENIFVVKDGVIHTPPPEASILVGITRNSAITIARDEGYTVVERNIVRSELYLADEVFFTGTAAEIVPVREIDRRTVGSGKPGPITRHIQEVFFSAVSGDNPRYEGWLDYVE